MGGEWTSGYSLANGVDLLIHDGQYTDAEYASRAGWGHSTFAHALEFARMCGVGELVLFHHNPTHTDDELDRFIDDAVARAQPDFRLEGGIEHATFKLGAKAHAGQR